MAINKNPHLSYNSLAILYHCTVMPIKLSEFNCMREGGKETCRQWSCSTDSRLPEILLIKETAWRVKILISPSQLG